MKRILTLAVALLLGSYAFAQLPSVKMENDKGATVESTSLTDGGSKPIVISFWSMTCKPCIRELDAISDVLEDWLDEVDFKMVAVSVDDSRFTTKARAFAKGRGWDSMLTLYDKNQDFMRAMNVSATPQVFVLDSKGKVVWSHTGYTPGSEAQILEAVKKAAAKK